MILDKYRHPSVKSASFACNQANVLFLEKSSD